MVCMTRATCGYNSRCSGKNQVLQERLEELAGKRQGLTCPNLHVMLKQERLATDGKRRERYIVKAGFLCS